MKGHYLRYLPEELAWIEANAFRSRAELHAAFCFRFGRKDVSLDNIKALCSRKGWKSANDGRFVKGQTPVNKGKPMPYHPNNAATRFKAGNPPANLKPMWHERLCKDGYIEMKVPLRNPYTGHPTRYMHKQHYLWEQVNGPVPKGHALKCLDGDKTNCDPSNWEAIPRALLPRLSGRWRMPYDSADPELKPTLLAIAKLEHKAKTLKQDGAELEALGKLGPGSRSGACEDQSSICRSTHNVEVGSA